MPWINLISVELKIISGFTELNMTISPKWNKIRMIFLRIYTLNRTKSGLCSERLYCNRKTCNSVELRGLHRLLKITICDLELIELKGCRLGR